MLYFLIFMIGACAGSFANVILTRKDWYKGRSRCDTCGYTLKWFDLIPIISYLSLRGRCRKCGTKIGFEHLLSECYMGFAFLSISYIFEAYGLLLAVIAGTGIVFLCLAAIEDFKEHEVSVWILLCGMVFLLYERIVWFIITKDLIHSAEIIACALIIFCIGTVANRKWSDFIGAGDFDLMIIMILTLGAYNFAIAITLSSVIGLCIYLPIILFKRNDYKMQIPFGPLLYVGSMTVLLLCGIY